MNHLRNNIIMLAFAGILLFCTTNLFATGIQQITSLASPQVKQIREDVRKSIYIIKSRRPAQELPDLQFFSYRLKKDDNFWTILSRLSLDMDTLISVNNLTSPRDVRPGQKIFFPNMRGIIHAPSKDTTTGRLLGENRVREEYVLKANKTASLNAKKHVFVPCAKLKRLQRSLFLGTGFAYPVPNRRMTSRFGRRRNPFNKSIYEFHTGVDIACCMNTPVKASRSGRVLFAGYKGGYGKLVIIGHEHGYQSYYGHLNRIYVKPGRVVRQGQRIALSGNTGRSTGPHLHFEIRKGGRPVNPRSLTR